MPLVDVLHSDGTWTDLLDFFQPRPKEIVVHPQVLLQEWVKRRHELLWQTSSRKKWGAGSKSAALSPYVSEGAPVNLEWVIYCFFREKKGQKKKVWRCGDKGIMIRHWEGEIDTERSQPVSFHSVYRCHDGAFINQQIQVLTQQTALRDWLFGRNHFGPNQRLGWNSWLYGRRM